MTAAVNRNGEISFWYGELGGVPVPRPPLPGSIDADVCIVGAGYTGLWAAYYLALAQPHWRIVVLEREFAGFGASGRNGGWLAGTFDWSRERYLQRSSRAAVIAMQQAMASTVAEVMAIAAREGIDADIVPTDSLTVALNPAQWQRLQRTHAYLRGWQVPARDIALLDAQQIRARIHVPAAHGALVMRGMARVQPAKLARGLAQTVERRGVQLYEQTEVLDIAPGVARTARGEVRARIILQATEAYSATMPGQARSILPLNSALIATEPLPDAFWADVGWQGHELLEDGAHAMCFAQRTADGRIAIGGRGVPYRYGSRTDHAGETQAATIEQLRALLARLLPQAAHVPIAHAWCGVLGVPRDWCARCSFDPVTGLGWAGGYVGLGVATANLAGRTLRDLVLRQESALTTLPWVNRQARRWEPEPLRWLGVHAIHRLYTAADRREAAGMARDSRLAQWGKWLAGG